MTVSRVLRETGDVRAEKVQRVRDAILELGYRRNENARSIRPGQRTDLFGLIVTDVSNPYYGQLELGVEEVLTSRGIRMLVGNSDERIDREQDLVSDFLGRKVDGLIVVPVGERSAHLQAVRSAGVPLVLASRAIAGFDVDGVVLDDVRGAYDGVATLLAHGHRRIAFLGHSSSAFTPARRLDGYLRAHADAGVATDPALIKMGQRDPEAARRALQDLLRSGHAPTAVFSANNRNTVGALRAIADSGMDPRAIAVVGFDAFELFDLLPFDLSVIEHDARALGRTAAELALRQLDSDAPLAPERRELPTRLRN